MGEDSAVNGTWAGARVLVLCLALGTSPAAGDQVPDEAPETPTDQETTEPAPAPEPSAGPEEPEEPMPPAEPSAIAGVASVISRSRLVFPGAPDQPHQLDATYVFPDRARWLIAPIPSESEESGGVQHRSTPESRRKARRLRFRWGTGLWQIEPGQQASRRFLGEELRLALLQTEMRRVAMIWPAELEWTGEAETRQASLPGIGVLHARLDPESGRPVELESRDPGGTPRERFAKIRWRTEGETCWPESWDLYDGETLAWHETIERVSTGRKLREPYFIPGDQRKDRVPVVVSKDEIERIKVPQFRAWRLRYPKEMQGSWDEVIESGKTELANWKAAFEGMSYVLDDRLYFFVDEDCRPFMLEIRIVSDVKKHPPEWILQGGYGAYRSMHTDLEKLNRIQISKLYSKVPKVEAGGGPHVAIQVTETGVGVIQLVLPVHSHF